MADLKEMARAFASIRKPEIMEKLFGEIFTESERNTLDLRWKLLKDLYSGVPKREIASRYGISLCKITRGSRLLKETDSIVLQIMKDINKNQ